MKSSKTKQTVSLLLIAIMFNLTFLPFTKVAAQTNDLKVKVRPDPVNPKRKIIELPRIQQKAQVIRLKQNVLDAPQFRRSAIPFQKFEMVSPSGKPLDPNQIIPLPDGRKITVKEFYDQSNKVEESLNQRGYSLRTAGTFDNIKLSISRQTIANGMIPVGAKKITQTELNNIKTGITAAGKTSSNVTVGKINLGTVKNVLPGIVGKLFASGSTNITGQTSEFPAIWNSTSSECSGGTCSLLIKIPKGLAQNYGKLVWQVSAVPFETVIDPLQAPNVVKVGIMKSDWNFITGKIKEDGVQSAGGGSDFSYMQFDINFAAFLPQNTKGKYYVRAVLTDQNNGSPGVTQSIALEVDTIPGGFGELEIPQTQPSTIYKQPNKSFPDDDSPFGFYFHKNNLSGTKTTLAGKTTGYRVSGGAELGVRYYNFEHLVNSDKPKSNEQSLLGAQFEAVVGPGGDGKGNTNGTQGARLVLSIAGQETVIPLTDQESVPTGEYSLNYGPNSQEIDQQLLYIVIPLIPVVNIVIEAKITGSYGYELSGKVNFMDNSAGGNLRLFVKTDFKSKADLEFPLGIAYVGMRGTSLPLFNAEINSSFSSDGKATVTQIGSYKALVIDVSLTAGFYHPCPPVKQIKKLWGYITGDEDTPLCQTEWNYNILENKNGYEDSWVIGG